eukprot:COSAG02_NODE_3840_length_6161_cov_19.811778_4_plen_98_part_00
MISLLLITVAWYPKPLLLLLNTSFFGVGGNAKLSVACYAGDGIGVDVTNATFRMLAAVQSPYGFTIEPTFYDWGCDYCDVHGTCAPDDMIDVRLKYR